MEHKTVIKGDLRLTINYDTSGDCNPRDWENLGTMLCTHRRYRLGDEEGDIEEIMRLVKDKDVISMPLYLFDHSGLSMSVSPYSCNWDSGQVGIIYADKDDIRRNWDIKHVTKKYIDWTYDILRGEVETYDMYLRGDVFDFCIEKIIKCETCGTLEYEHVDSCGGFYGYDFINNGMYDHVSAHGFTKDDLK